MKLAIALPGGGACGRWQAGAVKYLLELITDVGHNVDLICGTSVGGLNTLITSKYINVPQKIYDLWENIRSNKDVFLGMMQFNNFWDYIGMMGQTFKTNKGLSILDLSPLYHLLDTTFGDSQLKDLLTQAIITTTDMNTGERLIFDSTKNPLYKCADLGKCTSAIPLVFPAFPETVNGLTDLCNDGGVGRNNPIDVVIENSSTHIILIGTSSDVFPRVDMKADVLSIAMRMQNVIMHAFEEDSWKAKEQYETYHQLAPDKYPLIKFLDIYPQESTGSCLDFSNIEQFDKGYNYTKTNITRDVLIKFFG